MGAGTIPIDSPYPKNMRGRVLNICPPRVFLYQLQCVVINLLHFESSYKYIINAKTQGHSCKDKDKDFSCQDKDKDFSCKDKVKDFKLVLKDNQGQGHQGQGHIPA